MKINFKIIAIIVLLLISSCSTNKVENNEITEEQKCIKFQNTTMQLLDEQTEKVDNYWEYSLKDIFYSQSTNTCYVVWEYFWDLLKNTFLIEYNTLISEVWVEWANKNICQLRYNLETEIFEDVFNECNRFEEMVNKLKK